MVANPNTQEWSWDEMLAAFRALGGIVQNLTVRNGAFGRGLFPLDEEIPVRLHIPAGLLFPRKAIEVREGRICLREESDFGKPEREFFERYQNAFSWGAGGKSQSVAHIRALDGLAPDVRSLLISDFGFRNLLEGDSAERTIGYFLASRGVWLDDTTLLAPFVDLTNHAPDGLTFTPEAGLGISGVVAGEVLISYGVHDSLSIFRTFGFAGRQPCALSLPMKIAVADLELRVRRDTSRSTRRGNMTMPDLDRTSNALELSFLMIGNEKLPRMSRGIFCTLMRESGIADPDEAFDQILQSNWARFLNLLAILEKQADPMSAALRKMACYQLQAMAHCVGSRALEPLALPIDQPSRRSVD